MYNKEIFTSSLRNIKTDSIKDSNKGFTTDIYKTGEVFCKHKLKFHNFFKSLAFWLILYCVALALSYSYTSKNCNLIATYKNSNYFIKYSVFTIALQMYIYPTFLGQV